MRHLPAMAALILLVPLGVSGQSRNKPPETFSANAHVKSAAGAAATALTVQFDKYSTDEERERLMKEFTTGGAGALKAALGKSPQAGYVQVGDKKWAIRYARQQDSSNGRNLVAVLDQPLFFLGGGQVNAKPREGYDFAVVQFTVDSAGLGQGSVAAAAKLKAGGPAGLEVEDYADEPIKLVTVRKIYR